MCAVEVVVLRLHTKPRRTVSSQPRPQGLRAPLRCQFRLTGSMWSYTPPTSRLSRPGRAMIAWVEAWTKWRTTNHVDSSKTCVNVSAAQRECMSPDPDQVSPSRHRYLAATSLGLVTGHPRILQSATHLSFAPRFYVRLLPCLIDACTMPFVPQQLQLRIKALCPFALC